MLTLVGSLSEKPNVGCIGGAGGSLALFLYKQQCELRMVAFDSPQRCADHQSKTSRSSTNLAKKSRQLQQQQQQQQALVPN